MVLPVFVAIDDDARIERMVLERRDQVGDCQRLAFHSMEHSMTIVRKTLSQLQREAPLRPKKSGPRRPPPSDWQVRVWQVQDGENPDAPDGEWRVVNNQEPKHDQRKR